MADDDPAVRIRAMREAVDRERRDLLPSLVNRLEDDDPAVRLFAIVALERMTGQRFAYRPESDRSERQAAVAAWRTYLKENDQRRGQAESSGGTGASNARHAKNSAP